MYRRRFLFGQTCVFSLARLGRSTRQRGTSSDGWRKERTDGGGKGGEMEAAATVFLLLLLPPSSVRSPSFFPLPSSVGVSPSGSPAAEEERKMTLDLAKRFFPRSKWGFNLRKWKGERWERAFLFVGRLDWIFLSVRLWHYFRTFSLPPYFAVATKSNSDRSPPAQKVLVSSLPLCSVQYSIQ